jgi:predicted dehydrogenase
MDDIELVGVVDSDPQTANQAAVAVGATAFASVEALPDVDLAVVAVPTIVHRTIAEQLIRRGISVLVEKPLAPSPRDADHLVTLAEGEGVLLGTGHIERFNPVVSALIRLVRRPHLMQFSRLSPYTPRIRESIVFDLMVHDLDLACLLAGALPKRVSAGGVKVVSDTLDAASAVLTFSGGCIATVTSSRVTQDKVRRISVSELERFLDADCLRQELSVKRETTGEYNADAEYTQASVVEIPYLDRRAEPLALELRNFVDAVRGDCDIRVDGRTGAETVRLAYEIERMIENSVTA